MNESSTMVDRSATVLRAKKYNQSKSKDYDNLPDKNLSWILRELQFTVTSNAPAAASFCCTERLQGFALS